MKSIKILLFGLLFTTTFQVFSQSKPEGETAKAKKETKYTEVVNTDSLPASELLNRAVNWVKLETPRYTKASGVTSGSKAECIATFAVKPKELNPECDYTGKITMKVVIECKDNKYRYIINQIKHTSTSGKTTAGSIDNLIPECGSMVMGDIVWKKLKGEAIKGANIVIGDIKEAMQKSSKENGEDW